MSAVGEQWTVRVDGGTCIGSGVCLGIAPDRFALRDGVAVPTPEQVEDDERITDAALNCPVEAISVHLRASGARIAPDS